MCLYWQPLLQLALLRGLSPERAADAVQDFALKLLEKQEFIDRLDPARGRLRSFLRTAFSHHLDGDYVRERAQKRGGEYRILSLDLTLGDVTPDPAADPTAAYDRKWAESVLERALSGLRAEFQRGERGGPFEVVESYFRAGDPPSYQEVAARYAMSVPQVKAFLHRARSRYRELVEQELRDTLDDAAEIGAELASLLQALRT